jgi:hypothetical protein
MQEKNSVSSLANEKLQTGLCLAYILNSAILNTHIVSSQ